MPSWAFGGHQCGHLVGAFVGDSVRCMPWGVGLGRIDASCAGMAAIWRLPSQDHYGHAVVVTAKVRVEAQVVADRQRALRRLVEDGKILAGDIVQDEPLVFLALQVLPRLGTDLAALPGGAVAMDDLHGGGACAFAVPNVECDAPDGEIGRRKVGFDIDFFQIASHGCLSP